MSCCFSFMLSSILILRVTVFLMQYDGPVVIRFVWPNYGLTERGEMSLISWIFSCSLKLKLSLL